MSAGLLLMLTGGMAVAGGLVGVVAWWRGVLSTRVWRARRVRLRPVHGAAAAAGAAVLLVTGWPVGAVAAAAGVLFVPKVLGGGAAAAGQVARADALATWARRLSDLIASGAAGSIGGAIGMSAAAPPEALAGPIRAAAARLPVIGLEAAMRRLADEVADPAAAKIAGMLILAEKHGGAGLSLVLAELADDVEEHARMLREVEAERAKPRGNARTIVAVSAVLIAAMMVFSGTFLAGYRSPVGQVLLAGVFAVFAIALRWMRRLSDPPPQPCLLSAPASADPVEVAR